MAFCACEGASIYYEVHGRGRPLLLVSGLGGGCWTWFGQVPFYQSRYRTITFDNRGAGRSSMPEDQLAVRLLAEDALCLLDSLNVEDAFVMGLSMGGMIAQELALMAPHRVRALVLGCTHLGGELRIPPSPEVIQTLMANEGLSLEQIIDKNLPLFFSRGFQINHPELIEAYREVQLAAPEQPDHAFRAQLAAIQAFDCSDRFSHIAPPTLIVTGSQDIVVPRENSYLMAEKLPQTELVVLPGSGHALHVECRDVLNEITDHFFQSFDTLEDFPQRQNGSES